MTTNIVAAWYGVGLYLFDSKKVLCKVQRPQTPSIQDIGFFASDKSCQTITTSHITQEIHQQLNELLCSSFNFDSPTVK